MTIIKSFEKPLTPEEEVKYLTKFKEENDEYAKEVLIERNSHDPNINTRFKTHIDINNITWINFIRIIYGKRILRSIVCGFFCSTRKQVQYQKRKNNTQCFFHITQHLRYRKGNQVLQDAFCEYLSVL